MTDLMGLMKQAQAMQQKVAEAQAKLAASQVVGEAGAGLVSLTLSGKGEMRGLSIDPSLLDPGGGEIVEDLVMAAHNDARRKMEALQQEVLQQATGGMQLPPGLSLPV